MVYIKWYTYSMSTTPPIPFRLPVETLEQLEQLAASTGKSRKEVIVTAVDRYFIERTHGVHPADVDAIVEKVRSKDENR